MRRILVIPYVKIQNANALSSPYTIGFPAMTAWLGGVHALQRKLNADQFPALLFNSVGVACHHFDLKTYKDQGDFVSSIIGTGNPLTKEGKRPSTIAEARCHMTVSLVIEYSGVVESPVFMEAIQSKLHALKLAGGDILEFQQPCIFKIDDEEGLGKLKRKLMPSYVIIERRDLMIEAMKKGQDAMETMLDYLKVKNRCLKENDQIVWRSFREAPGWIVPIAVGFLGITPLHQAKNQRDPDRPHRFAEAIVTLGEFIMPYRIDSLDKMLWQTHFDQEKAIYSCQQKYALDLTYQPHHVAPAADLLI